MRLKNSTLLSFLIFLIAGWGFSYASQIAVAIPYQVKLNSAEAVAQIINAHAQQMIKYNEISANLSAWESEIQRLKNARYVIQPTLARGNFYILATSLLGSAFFDYLINYLEKEKSQYYQTIPPSDCKYLVGYPCQYTIKRVCNGSGGDFKDGAVDINSIVGWTNQGDGGCFAKFTQTTKNLSPGECIDIAFDPNAPYNGWRGYYLPGDAPSDWLACPNQPKKDYPPFVIPPISADEIKSQIPSGDFTATIPVPNSASIRTPQDINPPLSSPNGSVIYDIPNYSPDGVFSPDPSNPSNYVPDIPLNDPSIKINYTINDPITGKTYNYTDTGQTSTNSSNSTDYTYTPTDANLDTNIDIPQKKDLQGLITSNIQSVKSKFKFDNSCSGGACSFSVNVFGSTTTIDFCQFSDLFSTIGTIILTFAYFYAFFIVVRGG